MRSWRAQDVDLKSLCEAAHADRWNLPGAALADALERSARKAFADAPDAAELRRYTSNLHLADLALASACALGYEAAWEHFVREFRPILYRAAEAIDQSGGARELADSLYGELYGLQERDGQRRSLFQYFHGRSSLATWLRAILAQRHVDRVRTVRRFEPLPAADSSDVPSQTAVTPRHDVSGCHEAMRTALGDAVAGLPPRDRLRLSCYYGRNLTLAQIGAVLGEHEATVSRHLARVRREIRGRVERWLSERRGMKEAQIAECFESVIDDAGTLDVSELLGSSAEPDPAVVASQPRPDRKDRPGSRSKRRTEGASV